MSPLKNALRIFLKMHHKFDIIFFLIWIKDFLLKELTNLKQISVGWVRPPKNVNLHVNYS